MRRTIQTAALIVAAVILLSGCEGKFEDKASATQMQLNTAYTVYPGDEVIPSGPVQFSVRHTLSDDVKTITIVSGSALLLRGDYTLKR